MPATSSRCVDAMRARLTDWYDEVDVADAAVAAIDADPSAVLGPIGAVIVYLPLSVPPHHLRVFDAIGRHAGVVVVLGWTGVAAADEPAESLAGRFAECGAVHSDPVAPAGRAPAVSGSAVMSAPSADAEVLAVLRDVMDRNEEGTPLERMAIAHGGRSPYPRLIHESFGSAGIPYNGRGVRPLAATVAGRVLLGLFELPEGGWRREDVIAWVSTGPLRHGGRRIHASGWDRVSRDAGVVAGLAEWDGRLAAYAAALRRRVEEDPELQPGGEHEGRGRFVLADATHAEELAAFVCSLGERCAEQPEGWSGWVAWARSALRDLLGGREVRAQWQRDDETEAFTAIDDALGCLSAMDAIDPFPDPLHVRSAISGELEGPAPQTTRFGRGVLVAGIDEVAGLDLDVLFVVGMHDGAFPETVRDDPVLPDAERRGAGRDIPLRGAKAELARRDYLAALSSARTRVLSYPRGDQHSGGELRPSRWLLETVQALDGSAERVHPGDIERFAREPWFRWIRSYQEAVEHDGAAMSLEDRDLRSMLVWTERTGRLDGHPMIDTDEVLAASLVAARQRASARFTRFDGNLTAVGADVLWPETGGVQSPTRLESYARCPRRYFFRSLLRLDPQELPEQILRISAADRGNLMHRVLERYVAGELEHPTDAGPGAGESLEERIERINRIAGEVCVQFEQEGLTGRPLLWEIDRSEILSDLRSFVREDLAYRTVDHASPVAVEMAFGTGDGDAPVRVAMGSRREVVFRGRIDRLDQREDGSGIVLDYKSGRSDGYAHLEDDPVCGGLRLQLPVYALAASGRLGGVPVHAAYWFVRDAEGFKQAGFDFTDDVRTEFVETVATLVEGIAGGSFPGRPGKLGRDGFDNCRRCEFDSICPKDRDRAWDRVRTDPAVASYATLAEPELVDGDDPGDGTGA